MLEYYNFAVRSSAGMFWSPKTAASNSEKRLRQLLHYRDIYGASNVHLMRRVLNGNWIVLSC